MHWFLFVLGLVLLPACRKECLPLSGETTVRLTLQGALVPFDAPAWTRAASALTWQEGDRIFVRTRGASFSSVSVATLEADGGWSFRYKGNLTGISSVQCVFIRDARGSNDYEVSLSYDSVIYEDPAAGLTVNGDGSVVLTTWLRPKTGRIRFRSSSEQTIGLSGLSWYTTFDLTDFSFAADAGTVPDFWTGADHYFYGFFAEGSDRKLTINNDGLCFSRTFSDAVLRPGASGYIDVPTHEAYDNWTIENPEE